MKFPLTLHSTPPRRSGHRAFTLIELLVVISIIALLAALIVGLAGTANASKVRSRVKVELNGITGAIDKYHKKYGFYPPDRYIMPSGLGPLNSNQVSGLYYELTARTPIPASADNVYTALGLNDTARRKKGTVNSGDEAQNFFQSLPTKSVGKHPSNPEAELLTVPAPGPSGAVNPWYYNSSSPIHNAESYDLWAEVIINGKTEIIGNW